jgi:hypothetical protein
MGEVDLIRIFVHTKGGTLSKELKPRRRTGPRGFFNLDYDRTSDNNKSTK